jgi:hypothetical protein
MATRLRRWVRRLYDTLRPGASERSLERELATHLAFLERSFSAKGSNPTLQRWRRGALWAASLA